MDFLKTISYGGDGGDGGGGGGDGGGGVENVELSLGLSLNGRFGVERRRNVVPNDYVHKNNNFNNNNDNRIIRAASSVAELSSFEDPTMTLTRTCSLPMEAKRKRVDEKIKNGKGLLMEEENWEAKRRNVMMGNYELRQSQLLATLKRPSPLTSLGSPASGGSSGVSDLESQPFSGRNKDTELKSTASQHSILHKIPSPSPYRSNSIVSDRSTSSDETLKTLFTDMPCVSTKGDGANGKKIEGFLYRYMKGQEVKIVCVCHGHFLTPAEFVKHGGGGDVEHPLRHIVVNPPSL